MNNNNIIKLPPRGGLPRLGIKIEAPIKNKWGTSLKQILRNAARTIPEYFTPINCGVEINIEGEKIVIDTLGKWIFGTPGYKGNIVVDSFAENITVYLPKETPEEGVSLIKKAIERMKEGK